MAVLIDYPYGGGVPVDAYWRDELRRLEWEQALVSGFWLSTARNGSAQRARNQAESAFIFRAEGGKESGKRESRKGFQRR
jgi:hypothetical protein